MALYLGNQKVSLRSGQDPTFDYGFDSNGRLVFANKNATEINNFLNYDSSYSEILDLSNLSKMEKVAVNGTADRKMEGLKGLLVSPNAPFTGSSPQINASYTGLSKSALVSLFESAPYNVGYTKVGNPTIVDGVASGFSSSDGIRISNFPALTSNWELVIHAIAGSEQGQCRAIILNGMYLRKIANTWNLYFANGAEVWSGVATNYPYIKIIKTNNTAAVYNSADGTNYSLVSDNINIGDGLTDAGAVALGSSSLPWDGSIDLNETYIKVNGVPWFTGKPAMTKTCSIVGASGTSDLTQEDKNIILNKGWSLTVQ